MRMLSPYFESRKNQKRICPKCHSAALTVEPTLNINAAIDTCPECGYFQTVIAPGVAQVPDDWVQKGCHIIELPKDAFEK